MEKKLLRLEDDELEVVKNIMRRIVEVHPYCDQDFFDEALLTVLTPAKVELAIEDMQRCNVGVLRCLLSRYLLSLWLC